MWYNSSLTGMLFCVLFLPPVVSNVCQNDSVRVHADVKSLVALKDVGY